MNEREALEAKLPSFKATYRQRMQEYLKAKAASEPPVATAKLREVHASGLEYFNTINRIITLGALDKSETNPTWFSGMAETSINALDTILNHYLTVRSEATRLGMPRTSFRASRASYTQIQRIVKLHDESLAAEFEKKFKQNTLPVYGFHKEESVKLTKQEKRVGAVAGISFLVLLVVVALFVPNPTSYQEFIFRTLLALSGAAFASVISGFLSIEGKTQRFAIRAGAGFAVFVIIFLLNPPRLMVG